MKLVVLGAPGAGKGTQARNLAKYYKIPHVSTGDILRDEMKNGTELGNSIKELMDKGQLVSDEAVINIIEEYVAAGNYILDGFPRTLYQAEALDKLTDKFNAPLDKVVTVDVSDDIILERMSGRIVCPACGAMFHTIYYPPKKHGICDACGGKLIQREDDKAKTVENRLRIYHQTTEPIIKHYEDKGLLVRVSGVGNMDEITKNIVNALEEGF